ncbi:MAG: hypothetical protein WBD99_07310 [Thermodesulfobacteriota bacterium]
MKKLLISLIILGVVLIPATTMARTDVFFNFGIGIPAPVYVAPAPVFVAPQPVVVAPSLIYVPPAPVIIPPGHLPPPGEYRVWIPGIPPGHQPPHGQY